MSFARLQTRTRSSSAFTLVELMIVIAIVGILASLVTVGVMKGLEKGKQVAARTEISQLEAAIAAAKQNFGNVDNLPSALKLYNTPAGFQTDQIGVDTLNFLTKAFGRAWITNAVQNNSPTLWMGTNYSGPYPVVLTGMEALVYWLGGIRDATGTFQGFSSSPLTPWDLTTTKRKGPFFEFEAARVINNTATTAPTYVNSWNGSYAYFSSADYVKFNKTVANGGYGAYVTTSGSISPLLKSANNFYNPKTFQIISSGPDQTFGGGGFNSSTSAFGVVHNPGTMTGDYALGAVGYDDLANFSSTQLGKKDE